MWRVRLHTLLNGGPGIMFLSVARSLGRMILRIPATGSVIVFFAASRVCAAEEASCV